MKYNDCMSLLDFLNNRFRVFKNPWYTWGIEITWEKLWRWGTRLGWSPSNDENKMENLLKVTRAVKSERRNKHI